MDASYDLLRIQIYTNLHILATYDMQEYMHLYRCFTPYIIFLIVE